MRLNTLGSSLRTDSWFLPLHSKLSGRPTLLQLHRSFYIQPHLDASDSLLDSYSLNEYTISFHSPALYGFLGHVYIGTDCPPACLLKSTCLDSHATLLHSVQYHCLVPRQNNQLNSSSSPALDSHPPSATREADQLPSPSFHTQPRPHGFQPRPLLDEQTSLSSSFRLPRALPSSLTSAPIEVAAAAFPRVHLAPNPSPTLPSPPLPSSSEASPDS